ncbi:hypothetical protein L596_025839 [Steinernema carpocapsae]|uniref:Uncharacterized protein n=1 Tax=Steinernema carpocapsae TaxID=34508 RepID=A0A4U5M918_STECR|nr:hypothetical protein L596_025839 [Steinernema carpocapsae]
MKRWNLLLFKLYFRRFAIDGRKEAPTECPKRISEAATLSICQKTEAKKDSRADMGLSNCDISGEKRR